MAILLGSLVTGGGLWLGLSDRAAGRPPVGEQGDKVVDFGGREWFEVVGATVVLGIVRHAKVGPAGDDDPAESLVTDQGEECGDVDRVSNDAVVSDAGAVGAVATGAVRGHRR